MMRIWRLRAKVRRLGERYRTLARLTDTYGLTATAKAHLAIEQEDVAKELAAAYRALRGAGK